MAERYLFFNSAPGDPRTYQAGDFADYFGSVLKTGIIQELGVTGLQATFQSGMNMSVAVGKAIMQGYFYENTTPLTVAIDLPESATNRYDRIVLRLDLTNANRFIKVFAKRGTSSAPPTLQRDATIYEISLATIFLPANTSTINPANITDDRLNTSLAGTVGFDFDLLAQNVSINDAGGYFTETDVEAALQNYGAHKNNSTIHVTSGDKAKWNGAQLYPLTKEDGEAKESATTNANSYLDAGTYLMGSSITNIPETNGTLIVIPRDLTASQSHTQIFISSSSGKIYRRIRTSGTWGEWNKISTDYVQWFSMTFTGGAAGFGTGNSYGIGDDGRVYFEAIATLPNGMSPGTVISTLTASARPTKQTYVVANASNGQNIVLSIEINGQVIVNTATTSALTLYIYGDFSLKPNR